jgi:hypothetical protein
MSRCVVKLLPDKSGRILIHYFVHDPAGPAETPTGVTMTALGPLKLGGARGRIACQPKLESVTPQVRAGVTYPIPHSDDPRAVTCPACKETEEYKRVMEQLGEILETAGEGMPQSR